MQLRNSSIKFQTKFIQPCLGFFYLILKTQKKFCITSEKYFNKFNFQFKVSIILLCLFLSITITGIPKMNKSSPRAVLTIRGKKLISKRKLNG